MIKVASNLQSMIYVKMSAKVPTEDLLDMDSFGGGVADIFPYIDPTGMTPTVGQSGRAGRATAMAEAVGKNRATVANLLRLMNLNDDVKTLLEHGDIEMGHARALLGLDGGLQSEAAAQVVSRALTVRQTEALVRHMQENGGDEKAPVKANPDIQRLERMLGDRLGAKVAIQHSAKGKGKLVINYTTLDELDGILAHIK